MHTPATNIAANAAKIRLFIHCIFLKILQCVNLNRNLHSHIFAINLPNNKKSELRKNASGFLERPLFPGAPIYKTLRFFCWLGLFALPNLRLLRFVLSRPSLTDTLTPRDNSRPPDIRPISDTHFGPMNRQRQNLARTMKSRILKTPPTFLQTSYLFPFPFVFFIYRNFFLSRHPKKPLFKKTSA